MWSRSCLARILNVGVDPDVIAAAKAELSAQTKFKIHGGGSDEHGAIKGSKALGACFATMHVRLTYLHTSKPPLLMIDGPIRF